MRRGGGVAAADDLVRTDGVGKTEDVADVVGAAETVQNDVYFRARHGVTVCGNRRDATPNGRSDAGGRRV